MVSMLSTVHGVRSQQIQLGLKIRRRFVWRLIVLLLMAGGSARAQDLEGVGFDATPVRIPSVPDGPLRDLTSRDLLSIRDLKGVAISPDGKFVAFVVGQAVYEANSYRSGMFVVSTKPDSTPISLGTAGLPHWDAINQWAPEQPQWSPDSRYITYRARFKTTEKSQVWRWSVSGGRPRQLTSVPGDVQSYEWTPDGRKLVIQFEKPADPSKARKLSENGILYDGTFKTWRLRPIVSEVLANQPAESDTWIHIVATGEERKATLAESKSAAWVSDIGEQFFNGTTFAGHHLIDAKVSPNGRKVAYRYYDDSPHSKVFYKLFCKPARGGTPVDLAPGTYFMSQYWWAADSETVYYVADAGDGRPAKLMCVSCDGGSARQVLDTADFLYFYSADRNVRLMACARENAHLPGAVALVDLSANSVKTLVDLNPEFKNIRLGEERRLNGVNRYGDSWYAHLVKPLNYEPGKRYPLVVTTYRSHDGFLRGASGDENPIHVYAAHGLAVLSFDIGRSPQAKPRDFADYLSWYASELESIEMALEEASETGFVDTERVGLTGYSQGMEIVAYAVSHSRRFTAVSGAAGDTSPYFYYMASNSVKEHFSAEGLGGWPEGAARLNWKESAPDLNADGIDVPILNNDPDSEFLEDLALYTSLRELGKPVELFVYPNELHHVNQPKHRYEIYERNVDWFRFWLKNEEDNDPAKKEQYDRWRRMRDLRQGTSH